MGQRHLTGKCLKRNSHASMYVYTFTHKMKREKTATMRLHTYIRVWISNKERQPSAQLRVLGLFVRWKKLCIEKNAQRGLSRQQYFSSSLNVLWNCCGLSSRKTRYHERSAYPNCLYIYLNLYGIFMHNVRTVRYEQCVKKISVKFWADRLTVNRVISYFRKPAKREKERTIYIDNYITIPSCDT